MSPQPPTFDEVCRSAEALPCSPVLLPRLMRVLQNENAPADELEEIIQLDSALAGATLRLANSAYFGAEAPVATVGEAIIRLGFREIYRLAAGTLASRWLTHPVEGYGWEPGDFCRHSLIVAVAARRLVSDRTGVDPDTAYTAGLVHDMGKLAVAYRCGDWFPVIRERQQQKGCFWWQAEQEVLGYHQAEVGAQLLEKWRLPPCLVAAARFATRPAAGPAEHHPLLAALHAGKFIATTMGPGVAEDGFLFAVDAAFLAAHGYSAERLIAEEPALVDEVARLLGPRLHTGPVKF